MELSCAIKAGFIGFGQFVLTILGLFTLIFVLGLIAYFCSSIYERVEEYLPNFHMQKIIAESWIYKHKSDIALAVMALVIVAFFSTLFANEWYVNHCGG